VVKNISNECQEPFNHRHSRTSQELKPHHLLLMALLTATVFGEESSMLCRLNKQDISNCNFASKSLVQ